jgi:DNA repair exonuclease SbcCD ATPase subunit
MKLKRIEWANIGPYGNRIEAIEFDNNGSLWQLSGISGAGKSTIITLPQLLIYGKSGKIKVGSIANRINKNGYVKGVIQKGNDIWEIERGFSPNSLTITKNGSNDINRADKADVQTIINDEIMDGMPYTIFSNVLNLSLDNFKSFITMTPDDKRKIIDRVFSIDIINTLHEMVKSDIKELGSAINLANSQIYSLEMSINKAKQDLDNLRVKLAYVPSDSVENLESKIKELSDFIAVKDNEINVYKEKEVQIRNANDRTLREIYEISNQRNTITKKIELLNHDKCPTCGTPFTSDEFIELKKTFTENVADIDKQLEEKNANYNKLNDALNKMKDILKNFDDIKNAANKQIQECRIELTKIDGAKKTMTGIKGVEDVINENINAKDKMSSNMEKNKEQVDLLGLLEQLYGSNGIKTEIMGNYIPTLNDEISETLAIMHYRYTLEFDDKFEAHVEDMGVEIDIETLSKGERKKIDICVLCSMIRMIKNKYPQINIICLDETLSSLDYESSLTILECLKKICNDMGINIFVVSHTTLEESIFDHRVFIERVDGFSKLNIV